MNWISILILSAVLCTVGYRQFRAIAARPLPPGPKRLPLIGNTLQVAGREHMEGVFASLSRKYGDIMYLEFLGKRTVVLNSQKIARDLLEKRGAKYSSRPRMVTFVEMLGWYPTLLALPYGPSMRKLRRWVTAAYGEQKEIQGIDILRQRETCIFISGLMATPENRVLHIKRYLAALIVESLYGHRITSLDDPCMMLMDSAAEATTATGTTGGTLADMLPPLKHIPAWMPGAGFKRAALKTRELVWQAHHLPYRMTREAMASGNAQPSFVTNLVEEAEKAGRLHEEEEEIIYTAGVIYVGELQTKSVMLTFLLAMTLYPEVYAKAQEEMDRVVGKGRLPTLIDRQDLPYIESVLQETYRWHSPVSIESPHYTTEDDMYEGYYIPKGTSVMTNLWQICRDERNWDDAKQFSPERFFVKTGANAQVLDPRDIVFGHGRRICPGRQFADATLFLAIASIVATLDIRKARDAEGRIITPKVSFTDSFVSYPEDFVCSITPRSSAAESLVAETLAGLPE
ncbi:hypothetical protein FOMPIDRAFT_62440 [Fomitopsis schrenkii]|uniref:Cytochrome P450 n=1 Tax=Fomitopsis schrenkii TaxID=2126942 RepID=S8DLG9_FOMSC|nr:hypothetical protein FOMPIDRAFT_62440 [Fomitopsis schrenkii]